MRSVLLPANAFSQSSYCPTEITCCFSDAELEHQLSPVTTQYPEVEICVDVSVKQKISVDDLYYHSQRIVLYPSSVLLDVSEDSRPLRPAVVAALNRIFQLVDEDNDGLVSDAELNGFQQRVFDATLSADEIAGVKVAYFDRIQIFFYMPFMFLYV